MTPCTDCMWRHCSCPIAGHVDHHAGTTVRTCTAMMLPPATTTKVFQMWQETTVTATTVWAT